MSVESRSGHAAVLALAAVMDPRWADRHRGSTSEFLKLYRRQAARAVVRGLAGLREIAPTLLTVISHERSLFAAWQHMAKSGGRAPGPDGLHYDDLSTGELWTWCRGERDDIRAGHY